MAEDVLSYSGRPLRRGELYWVARPTAPDSKRLRVFAVVGRQELIDSKFGVVICAPVVRLCYSNPPMAAPTRGRSRRRDPLERTMEAALRPGLFIRYGESFAFVQDLERIARSIDGLVAEAPARAGVLFETFLAGCYLRIVDEAKSKYYRFALSHLARAKRCYEKAGLGQEWEATVKDVRKRHRRKSSFIPGFEKVVKGLVSKRSSFLDRARKRWAGPPHG